MNNLKIFSEIQDEKRFLTFYPLTIVKFVV